METKAEAVEAIRRAIVTSRALHRRGLGDAQEFSYRQGGPRWAEFIIDGERFDSRQPYLSELLGLIDAYNYLKTTV
jgi:hypothetical protein